MIQRQNTKSTQSLPSYVSLLDDPRVTLEMADKYIPVQLEYWDEGEEEFLVNMLADINKVEVEETILFPISGTQQLATRLIELASWHYGKEYNFYSPYHVIKVAFKLASKKFEQRIGFSDNSSGDYGNPELQLFSHTYQDLVVDGSASVQYFQHAIGLEDNDFDFENGSPILVAKFQGFVAGLIWTATNNGSNTHKNAMNESSDIHSAISMNKQKGLNLKRLTNFRHVVSLKTNGKTLAEGEYQKNNTPVFSPSSIQLDPKNDEDVILTIQNYSLTSGMFREGTAYTDNGFIVQYENKRLTVVFS